MRPLIGRIERGQVRRALMSLLVLVALCAMFPERAASSVPSELAAHERGRVLAGELVVRERSVREGGRELFGGRAWLRVDAPAERVWQLFARPALYRQTLPHAVESRAERGGVRIAHSIGPSRIEYRLGIERDEARRRLRFAVVPDGRGPVRAGRAELSITPLGHASSVIEWSVLADADLGLLDALLRPAVQDAMLQVPLRIRELVVIER